MEWLILRNVLNTVCNITNAANKGVGGWVRGGETDGHSSPDHTTRRADVKWNSLRPQPGYPT